MIDPVRRPGAAQRAPAESRSATTPRPTSRSTRPTTPAAWRSCSRSGDFQFFDAGDLTWNVEKKLVCPIDLIGKVDLYQVTHHGMDISNHPTLVQTIAPTVAIMNNGPRKGGAPATVKLLRSIPSIQAAYQLHRNAATGPEDNTDAGADRQQGPGGRADHSRLRRAGRVELHGPDRRGWDETAVYVSVELSWLDSDAWTEAAPDLLRGGVGTPRPGVRSREPR